MVPKAIPPDSKGTWIGPGERFIMVSKYRGQHGPFVVCWEL